MSFFRVAIHLPRSAAIVLQASLPVLGLMACSNEARPIRVTVPLTAPTGPADARVGQYQNNFAHVSQGGRYFLWYGCTACHGAASASGPDLASGRFRHGASFDAVYRSISEGQPGTDHAYAGRIPVEPMWQITAYVQGLSGLEPRMRRRQDLDTAAEPRGTHGPEPVR